MVSIRGTVSSGLILLGFCLSLLASPVQAQCTALTPAQMFLDPNSIPDSSSYPISTFAGAPATLNIPNGGNPVVGLRIAPPIMLNPVDDYVPNVDYNACIDVGVGTGQINFLSNGGYVIRVDRMSGSQTLQMVDVGVFNHGTCFREGPWREFPCPTPPKGFRGNDIPPGATNLQCGVASINALVTAVCMAAAGGPIDLFLDDHGCEGAVIINGQKVSCAAVDAANLTAFCALGPKVKSVTLLSCSTGHGAAGTQFLQKLSTKFGGISVTGYTGNVSTKIRNGTLRWGVYGQAKTERIPQCVPAVSTWGFALLAFVLAFAGWRVLRNG